MCLRHYFCFYFWRPDLVATTQGMPLDHMALVARNLCSWVSWEATTLRALHREETEFTDLVFL